MPQLTTKTETNQQATTTQRKPTLATQLAVRNEQIENTQTFDPTKQFVNTSSAPQTRTQTDTIRSREINNQQNAENQVLGRDKRKKRSIDSDPEFASIHTIMIAAARAAAQTESNQQDIGPQKGLEVSGVEVSNFAREVVKEMANRGLPLNLSTMQDALGQALEAVPGLNNEKAEAALLAALGKEVEKTSEIEARIKSEVKERVIAPIFRAVPDPFDPRHQELLQQQLAFVPEVAPELNAKQLKGLVESVYNATLQEQTERIVSEKDTEKRAALLADMESIRAVPYFMLQQKAPWLFKNPETAAAILQLKQESIATDLELTAGRLVKGQDGAAFDQTWRQLSAEAELTYSDVFTKEFRTTLDLRRGKVWESAERKVRLETEVERTLIELLDTNNLLDNAYQTRKAALAEKFQAQGQGEQFARIIQRIEVSYIEKAITAAAKDPFNTEHSFGLTILQGTREQFALAFPHLAGTSLDSSITTARRRAGINMAFEGVNIEGLKNLPADNLSPILAAQEAQAYQFLPGLRADSMFKYNLRAEFESRLANEREITRTALSFLRSGENDPVAAAREANPVLADGIVEKYRDLVRQRDEISRRVDAFELQSRTDTVSGRSDKLATLRLALAQEFPELAKEQGVFEGTIIKAIDKRRNDKDFEFAFDHPGQMSIDERVNLFISATGDWYTFGGGTQELQLIQALSGLSPYGISQFRERLAANVTGRTSPEAILTGELGTDVSDGEDGAYLAIAKALLNADHLAADKALIDNLWKLGRAPLDSYIATTPLERRVALREYFDEKDQARFINALLAAAGGDVAINARLRLSFRNDPLSLNILALRQSIDSKDALSVTTQMRTLSAADASAEKLRQAIISGDRERILRSVNEIRPEHLPAMDQIFEGKLGQRLAQVLPNDPVLPALAQRLGVKAEAGNTLFDHKDFQIRPMVSQVEREFRKKFNQDWREVAQNTEDLKLRMAAAGDEIALALADFKETVGSFQLGLLGSSDLRGAEAGRLINTLVNVADSGRMSEFKAAFEREYDESLEVFIKTRLYMVDDGPEDTEWNQEKILAQTALRVVSGEKISTSDKLIIGLVLVGYSKLEVPAITSSLPPTEVVNAAKELALQLKSTNYYLANFDINGLSAKLDAAVTPEAQRQAAADLLFAIYEIRHCTSLTGQEILLAKHAFRGQADTLEQIRRLKEIAEYNRARVEEDNSFNYNPVKLFGAPSVAINSIAKSDDQVLIDAKFAAETAANLQKRFELSEAETRAFEVHSRLGSKESLTPEEEREARIADELMKSYSARLAAMSPEELALLRTAQSRLDAATGAYSSMRSTAHSIVTTVGEVAVVIVVSTATAGAGASLAVVMISSSGASLGVRYLGGKSIFGDDYTDDMLAGDLKHAAIMGISQGGAQATMTFFKGLATKGIAAAGNKIPALGQALQTAKKAEDVAASLAAKAAQVEANAAAAAGRQAAALANSVNASGGAVSNFITKIGKSGLEWGAMGGTAGAISSVLNNTTSADFWGQHGLIGGLEQLATQAGEDAVVSAIISAKLGLAAPITVAVSRSVWSLRSKINGMVEEAKSEIRDTLIRGEIPATRPAAQPSAAKPQVVVEPISTPPARPTSQPAPQHQLTTEMAATLRNRPLSKIVDEVGFPLNPNGTPRAPQPRQTTAPEAPAKVAAENPDLAGKWGQFEDDFYRMMGEPTQTAKVQSTPVKDAPKPPSDGGNSSSGKAAEPIKPPTPEGSTRISPEKLNATARPQDNNGGEVLVQNRPAKTRNESIDPNAPKIEPRKLDDMDIIVGENGGEIRPVSKPPGDGGSSSSGKAAEPIKPTPPKDSTRISAEKQDATALKAGKDGGDVAVMDRPAAKPKEGIDPSKPKIEPQKLDDKEFFWGETGGEMRPVSKPAVEPAQTARPKPPTENVVQSSKPTIKPQNLDDQLIVLDESGAVAFRPMTQPTVKPAPIPAGDPVIAPRVTPGIKPTATTPELAPSVQPQPALSPSVSTNAPGMRPSLSDMTASSVGAENSLYESAAPKSRTDSSPAISPDPQAQPQPKPAQQPGPRTATKASNKRKDDDPTGFFSGLADEPVPGNPPVYAQGVSPDFEPGRIGELALDPYNPQAPQMSTLERIELENKQREKKTKVITHYTRRRRRLDGTEYDGDFDIVSDNNEELDAKGNPLKNGSRVVTGDRIVTVQIGTTVTRSED